MNKRVLRGALSEQGYHTIKRRILTGELPLGATLSRRRLSEELQMSFSPISEALQKLEAEGLVESRARVGTVVRIPSPRDVREHCIVRQALEVQAARLFAEKATNEEGREIMEMATRLDALFQEQGAKEFDRQAWLPVHEFHLRLHLRLVECTGVQALCEATQKTHTLILNWMLNTASDYRALPLRFHQELIEVLLKGDPALAEEAMRQHTMHGEREIVRRIERYQKRLHSGHVEHAKGAGNGVKT